VADVRAAVCAGGYVTQREYDELGKLTKTTDASGGVFRFVYDEVRNLVARADAKGNLTTYEYSPRNERVAEHQHLDEHAVPDRASVPLAEGPVDVDAGRGTLDWTWSYDASGNVATKTDPKHQTVTYVYGVLDRVASETWSGQALPRELPSCAAVAEHRRALLC
jgi:YD repeat-containing protein